MFFGENTFNAYWKVTVFTLELAVVVGMKCTIVPISKELVFENRHDNMNFVSLVHVRCFLYTCSLYTNAKDKHCAKWVGATAWHLTQGTHTYNILDTVL